MVVTVCDLHEERGDLRRNDLSGDLPPRVLRRGAQDAAADAHREVFRNRAFISGVPFLPVHSSADPFDDWSGGIRAFMSAPLSSK